MYKMFARQMDTEVPQLKVGRDRWTGTVASNADWSCDL